MHKKFCSKIYVFAAMLFALTVQVHAQQDIYLFIDSTTIIGRIADNKIYTSETDIGYTIQGKIIYKGDVIASDFILLIADVDNFFSKRTGIVYREDGKTVQYITQKNEIYLGDYPINRYYERLLILEKKNDSVIIVYNGIDESVAGTIEGHDISSPQLIAAAHLYIKHYELDKQVARISAEKLQTEESATAAGGSVRPRYATDPYNEWVWDGEILKPAIAGRPEDEWKFDGKYLQPVWNLDPQSEWSWDGAILKPSWDQTTKNQWTWDGNILRPFWDNDPDKTYILEDNILRPMWSYDPAYQWEVEGEIPLPVLAIIVLHIAGK